MTLSDQIRDFVFNHYIASARANGIKQLNLRCGDVHDQMNLSSRYPAVIGALTANKFQQQYNIKLISQTGPMGANHYFIFEI